MTRGTPITNLPSDYKFIGRGYLGPIPFIVVILLVLVAVFAFIFKYTQFGRNIVTVGENATSARLSGINVVGIKISAYACTGALSALSGIMLMARLGSGQPTAASDLCLTAMAAVFVGGTSAINTQGAALKTLGGALFIGMINNGPEPAGGQRLLAEDCSGLHHHLRNCAGCLPHGSGVASGKLRFCLMKTKPACAVRGRIFWQKSLDMGQKST